MGILTSLVESSPLQGWFDTEFMLPFITVGEAWSHVLTASTAHAPQKVLSE